jgi:hypothetical protein
MRVATVVGRFLAGMLAVIGAFAVLALPFIAYEFVTLGHTTFPMPRRFDDLVEFALVVVLPGALVFLGIDWLLDTLDRTTAANYAAIPGTLTALLFVADLAMDSDRDALRFPEDAGPMLLQVGMFATLGCVAGTIFWGLTRRARPRTPSLDDIF